VSDFSDFSFGTDKYKERVMSATAHRAPREFVARAQELLDDETELYKVFMQDAPPANARAKRFVHDIESKWKASGKLGEAFETDTDASHSVKHIAWTLALMTATNARVTQWCTHSHDHDRIVMVNLTMGFASCTACLMHYVPVDLALLPTPPPMITDDNWCDVCDEPETEFREIMQQYGQLVLTANICDACVAWTKQR
jgi:hypothetical protein